MTRSTSCGSVGDEALRDAAHLVEFGHEIVFGVEASGGIDD